MPVKTSIKIFIVAACIGLFCASAMAHTLSNFDHHKVSKGSQSIIKVPGLQKSSDIAKEFMTPLNTIQKTGLFDRPIGNFNQIGQISESGQNALIPSPVQGEPGSPQGAESEQSVGCCQKVEWVNGQFLAYNCTIGGDCYCDTITGICDCEPVQTIPIENVTEYLKSLK